MAKDILVTELLSEQMIKAGAKLVERLDAITAQVKSAFWLFLPEERTWQLVIASPLVASEGPRNFYKRVVEANQKAAGEEKIISLNNISVTGIEQQIVQLIRLAIKTDGEISDIRFSRNTINGVFIEDSYIYRSST